MFESLNIWIYVLFKSMCTNYIVPSINQHPIFEKLTGHLFQQPSNEISPTTSDSGWTLNAVSLGIPKPGTEPLGFPNFPHNLEWLVAITRFRSTSLARQKCWFLSNQQGQKFSEFECLFLGVLSLNNVGLFLEQTLWAYSVANVN